jgi:hypothetical protein
MTGDIIHSDISKADRIVEHDLSQHPEVAYLKVKIENGRVVKAIPMGDESNPVFSAPQPGDPYWIELAKRILS